MDTADDSRHQIEGTRMKSYTNDLQPGEIRILPRKDFDQGPQRLAELKLEEIEALEYAVEKGEVVLRRTEKGARNVQAKFFEAERDVYQLSLHYYTEKTGFPHAGSFPLRAGEISKLFDFLDTIQRVHLPSSGGVVVEPRALEHERFTDDRLVAAIRSKPDLAAQVIETEATSRDVKAMGFRRKSLAQFKRYLSDNRFFDDAVSQTQGHSPERVWQTFFEANRWIFGYGLSYIFFTAADPERLELAVAGYSTDWRGKRPDAVMRTRGAVSALCLVEIKTHRTDLVSSRAVRPSTALTSAITQSQSSVVAAERVLRESFTPKDSLGNPLSSTPIYNYRPRSYVVAGQLSEFYAENGLNEQRYSSFEMYRRNLISPEVITFDELFERAKFIVEHPD